MIFRYTKDDFKDLKSAEKFRFIQGNGLGGFIAATAAFSVSRCDDGLLCSSVQCPNVRKLLVHRLKESLWQEGDETILSMQRFGDGREEGRGLDFLQCFEVDALPAWTYQVGEVSVRRTCAILYGRNASVVSYEIENAGPDAVEWTVDPGFLMNYKGEPCQESGRAFHCEIISGRDEHIVARELADSAEKADCAGETVRSGKADCAGETVRLGKSDCAGQIIESEEADSAIFSMEGFDQQVRILTDGSLEMIPAREDQLAYPDDGKDGRPEKGFEAHALQIRWQIPAGTKKTACIFFALDQEPDLQQGVALNLQQGVALNLQQKEALKTDILALLGKEKARREDLYRDSPYAEERARELCRAADLFLSRKEATNGSTLIAGYPLFGDWGRDTMISLPGCMLSTGKYREAREIFQTFLKYEKNGLVPNLFPEKGLDPWYNTVDAPLLLIEGLKLYADRTRDWDFIGESYDALRRIIRAYQEGTDFNIHMDQDYLICEGEYPWQLTWMDACIDGILPTPRYGKPVEINAYWYNALMIMAEFADCLGKADDQKDYLRLAEKVKASFISQFWLPEKGYLKDLVSGEDVDLQIRCNQIWALTLTYTMLSQDQERKVLRTVKEKLYTPFGLRTLSPDDPAYKGYYGGPQFDRDMAYHQGTIWVYPLGAWYRAVLKTENYSAEAIADVKEGLQNIAAMMREGCAGQLPEIYDGDTPGESKGCYAQCWSVGEILRVYEELERCTSHSVV